MRPTAGAGGPMTIATPPAASPPAREEPILILSCYRTGSTLLRYILDAHAEVYAPPELYLGEAARYQAIFACGLAGMRYEPEHVERVPAATLDRVRDNLAGPLRAAAADRGKRVWCEKTPSNLAPINIGLLRRLLPAARKICLHRHCLDVAQSLLKMMELGELQPFLAASRGFEMAAIVDYWNERTATLLQIEREEAASCCRVRYEDLVAEPAQVASGLFRFLDLAWDERLLAAAFDMQHDKGLQDHYIGFTRSIHAGNVGAGRALALDGVPERSLATMTALLRQLGYPEVPVAAAPDQAGAAEPAPASVQDVQWFFETHLPGRMRKEPSLCASFGTLYQFMVGGTAGGAWVVDPRRGQVAAGRSSAVCNVEVSAGDLFAIARGGLHPFKAAEEGRLRLRGDIRFPDLEKLVRLIQLAPPAPPAAPAPPAPPTQTPTP
jgi:protein-tyrosine sulfotransferase